MKKILVTDGMDRSAVEELRKYGYEVVEEHLEIEDLKIEIKKYNAVVVRSATKIRQDVIDVALESKKLELIIRGGVGLDNIDVEYAKSKGIKVFNTPNASSGAVAELVIGHILSLARNIGIANVTMRKDQWNKKKYKGFEISGKTLGLIGFGRIAKEVAKKAYALGMNVLYTNRTGKKDGYEDYIYASKEEILKQSDFISIHMPFKKGEKPVLSKEDLKKAKHTAYIINTARGGLIDEKVLIEALHNDIIAGVGLDVFEEEPTKNKELYKHSRVSVTPHIGGATIECQAKIGKEIVRIIKDNLEITKK